MDAAYRDGRLWVAWHDAGGDQGGRQSFWATLGDGRGEGGRPIRIPVPVARASVRQLQVIALDDGLVLVSNVARGDRELGALWVNRVAG